MSFPALLSALLSAGTGGALHPAIEHELRADPLTGPGLFCAPSSSGISRGEAVLRVPVDAVLSREAGRGLLRRAVWEREREREQGEGGGEDVAEQEELQEELQGLDPVLLLLVAARLALERGEGESLLPAHLRAYILLLPTIHFLPLLFSPPELALLQATPLYAFARAQQEEAKVDAQRARRWMKEQMGWEVEGERMLGLWKWAKGNYSSRAFPPALAGLEADAGPILIPLMDAGNHRRGARVAWACVEGDGDDEGVDASATSAGSQQQHAEAEAGQEQSKKEGRRFVQWTMEVDIPPGAQVCNNYGAKSNEEFLASYGFVDPSSCGVDDVLSLRLGGASSSSGASSGAAPPPTGNSHASASSAAVPLAPPLPSPQPQPPQPQPQPQQQTQPQTHYWRISSPPPSSLLHELATTLGHSSPTSASASDEAATRQALEERGELMELLESLLCARRKGLKAAERGLEWESADVREEVKGMVRVYRRGYRKCLDFAIEWTRSEMDRLIALLDSDDESSASAS